MIEAVFDFSYRKRKGEPNILQHFKKTFRFDEVKEMEAEFGENACIDSWMQLVRAVRWNIPGLETEESFEEHKQTALKFMNKQQALCVMNQETVAGVLLFSSSRNMICCLAVDPEHRKQRLASILLRKALDELGRSKEITVTTFREDDPINASMKLWSER